MKPTALAGMLQGYNPYTVKYLVNSFTFGFCISCVKIPDPRPPPQNHPPVMQNMDMAQQLVFKEVKLGGVLGLYKEEPITNLT